MTSSFKMQKQPEGSNWCWAAVGVSVKKYFSPHSTLDQCHLAGEILHDQGTCKKPPSGLDRTGHLECVLQILKLLNEPPRAGALSFDDVRKQINASLPVCVRIGWDGQDSGHFVVICGFAVTSSGEQWVDIADPHYDNSFMPYDDFVNFYQGDGLWDYTFLVQQSQDGGK